MTQIKRLQKLKNELIWLAETRDIKIIWKEEKEFASAFAIIVYIINSAISYIEKNR